MAGELPSKYVRFPTTPPDIGVSVGADSLLVWDRPSWVTSDLLIQGIRDSVYLRARMGCRHPIIFMVMNDPELNEEYTHGAGVLYLEATDSFLNVIFPNAIEYVVARASLLAPYINAQPAPLPVQMFSSFWEETRHTLQYLNIPPADRRAFGLQVHQEIYASEEAYINSFYETDADAEVRDMLRRRFPEKRYFNYRKIIWEAPPAGQ